MSYGAPRPPNPAPQDDRWLTRDWCFTAYGKAHHVASADHSDTECGFRVAEWADCPVLSWGDKPCPRCVRRAFPAGVS